MANQFLVIQSNPGCMLIKGQTVKPYYEDENEIILDVPGAAFSHHIRKGGQFFKTHLKPIGGN